MDNKLEINRSTIRISNLALRTIIGFNDWERREHQDVIINVCAECDCSNAVVSDNIGDSVDYKQIKRDVVLLVEESSFNLLESLTHAVLEAVVRRPGVIEATVRIDKPHALRFADSVSVEMSGRHVP